MGNIHAILPQINKPAKHTAAVTHISLLMELIPQFLVEPWRKVEVLPRKIERKGQNGRPCHWKTRSNSLVQLGSKEWMEPFFVAFQLGWLIQVFFCEKTMRLLGKTNGKHHESITNQGWLCHASHSAFEVFVTDPDEFEQWHHDWRLWWDI